MKNAERLGYAHLMGSIVFVGLLSNRHWHHPTQSINTRILNCENLEGRREVCQRLRSGDDGGVALD